MVLEEVAGVDVVVAAAAGAGAAAGVDGMVVAEGAGVVSANGLILDGVYIKPLLDGAFGLVPNGEYEVLIPEPLPLPGARLSK